MKRFAHLQFFFAGILAALSAAQEGATLRITELAASASHGLVDEDGEVQDWIEIHNASTVGVDLAGWHLSNDEERPTQWAFPSRTLEPDAFLIVFASEKDRTEPNDSFLHTNFRLALEGEFLALVEPDGVTLASVFSPYPEQVQNYSYGTVEGAARFFATPSPGAGNKGGVEGFVAEPLVDVSRGFYDEPFSLTLSSETEGAVIRFTTDGSEPSLFSGKAYTAPIVVDTTTILRAVAQKSGYASSRVVTQTYLFLGDVLRQSADGNAPPGWPGSPVKGQQFYYQMHPAMLDRLGEGVLLEALRSLPALSLVTHRDNLVDPKTGIYVNAEERGLDWERPASLELLAPSGQPGFAVSCGVRIRGGISRSGDFPKHSFRVLFRERYGDAKLRYPLFEDEGVDEFDNVDLRSSTNWDWASLGYFPSGSKQNTLLRDINSRDTQGALGRPYTRSRYYHLYLNGLYWGIYMTQERAEASYAASYLGGGKADYDVIKINRGPGAQTEATDGDMDAWRQLHTLSRAHEKAPSFDQYMAMQGLRSDGSRDPDLPVLLDVDRLIDYLLIIYWTANNDAPISQWGDNDWANNWYGIRNRVNADAGFHFFIHDAENSYGINGYDLNLNGVITSANRTGPYRGSNYQGGVFSHFNPQFLHQHLMENSEYRLAFADRVQRHCFHRGALTDAAVEERFRRRRDQVAPAIPAHAARWGHRFASQGQSHDERGWEREVDRILTEFIPGRTEILLGQLRDDALLAAIDAPEFNQHGGSVSSGFRASLIAELEGNEQIYYTLDGTDPRLPGGSVSPVARVYDPESDALLLESSVTVGARVRATTLFDPSGGDWSALTEAHFLVHSVPADATNLIVSEIHYHPARASEAERDAGFTQDKDFEFLELHNPSSAAVSLRGVRVTGGIEFAFSHDTEIAPGGYAVIARHAAAFALRYGQAEPVLGTYAGSLSNGGERIALVDGQHAPLFEVTYGVDEPWPGGADGEGFSLTLTDAGLAGGASSADRWRASSRLGGSPGWPDSIVDSGAPPRILSLRRGISGLELRWESVVGKTYGVEYASTLEADSWVRIATHLADAGITLSTDTDSERAQKHHGFYRVARLD